MRGRLSRILAGVLRSGLTYSAARTALGLLSRKMSPYQLVAVRGALEELHDAYTGRRPVILTSAFVPTEMVYGLGAIPYLPEMWSGFAAAFGLSQEGIDESEALGYSQDLCSFHRCHLGFEGSGLIPRPSAIIVSSHLCDGGRCSLYAHSVWTGCPFYVIDVPYALTDDSLKWLSAQVERICEDVCRKVPGLDLNAMPGAIRNSNLARQACLRVWELRKRRPAPWSGAEALNYVFAFLTGFGSKWLVEFYSALGEVLRHRIEKGYYPVPEEHLRLLWLNLRPYYGNPLYGHLERWGVSIAFEEYNHVYWSEIDEGRWAEGIALKMLSNFGWGPIERRLCAIEKMARDYRVDGVVQFGQWGCRQSNGGGRIAGDFLRRKGIPFLELEGDGVDPRNSSLAQSLTRLQSFVELLESRRQLDSREAFRSAEGGAGCHEGSTEDNSRH